MFENDAENGCERGWNCLRNVFSFIRIIKNLIKFQISQNEINIEISKRINLMSQDLN